MLDLISKIESRESTMTYVIVLLLLVFLLRFIILFIIKKLKGLLRSSDSNVINFKFFKFDPKKYYLLGKISRSKLTQTLLKSNISTKNKLKISLTKDLDKSEYIKGLTFMGLDSQKTPCYIDLHERSTHMQVIGRTGSGKSASILRNMIYQDIFNNRGVIVIDAKGSSDFRRELVGMCVEANRSEDFRVLNLGDINNSHSYSPFYIAKGVSPQAIADRFFTAIAPNKDEASTNYYLKQQASILRLMVTALSGLKRQFKADDLYNWLMDPTWGVHILENTSETNAVYQFQQMRKVLGRDFSGVMSGLIERMQVFSSLDILNTSYPDIKMDEVFQQGLVLYCQLPTGSNPLLAKDIARVIFQDIEYETSLREIGNLRNKNKFIAVYADEFYEWTYEEIVGAIGKARSGNVSWLVAHQSKSDLERLGTAFWQGVWDNTANKIILEQTDPDLADFISKSLGTESIIKETWRSSREMGLSQDQGEQSNRQTDVMRFNPNNLKNLDRVGQGFLLQGRKFKELNFGLLDPPMKDIQIIKTKQRRTV